MITHGKKTKLQINMSYVSMDVMVICVQKMGKKLRKYVTLLSLICLCVRIWNLQDKATYRVLHTKM